MSLIFLILSLLILSLSKDEGRRTRKIAPARVYAKDLSRATIGPRIIGGTGAFPYG